MATVKKAATKKTAGKSMVKWDEELARRAKIARATADSSSHGGAKQIKTSGGRLQVDGAEVPGNKMNVIILDHCIEHAYYEGKYNPDNPSPPIAWALGRDEATLVWDENSAAEITLDKVTEAIAGQLTKDSYINQYGTADTGRGKAAKNIQRLMVITEGDLEDIPNAEPRMLKVPTTSVKGWNGYVKQLDDNFNRPPVGVITEISLVPDSKSQFKMVFKLVDQLDDEYFAELFPKADSVESDLFAPYEPRTEEEEAPAPRRGGGKGGAPRGGAAARSAVRKAAPVVPTKKPSKVDFSKRKAAEPAAPAKSTGKRKF